MSGFEWDEEKRQDNIRTHEVDFLKASRIFEQQFIEAEDERQDYGEIRYRALGRVRNEYFVVVYTWRGEDRRIISAWKVDEDGKERYQAILGR